MAVLTSTRRQFLPRILNLPIARKWARSGKWDPSSLCATLHDVRIQAKRSKHRFFMYADSFSSVLLPDTQASEMEMVDFTLTEMIQACRSHESSQKGEKEGRAERGSYYYYTHPVKKVDGSLMEHLEGWQSLQEEVSGDVYIPPSPDISPYISMWMGGKGVITQAHYDVASNVFVQVYGTKTICLYPPSSHLDLYLYPDAHPRARKSQVNFSNPDLKLFPRFGPRGGPEPFLEVHLQPGDAIYIPSFWFHHVEATSDFSISLNVFSPSLLRQAVNSSFQHPSPLLRQWCLNHNKGVGEKIAGLRVMVRELLHTLGLESESFVEDIIRTRFHPLYQTGTTVHGHRDPLTSSASSEFEKDLKAADALLLEEENALVENAREIAGLLDERVRAVVPEGDSEHVSGVIQLGAAHLIELWWVSGVGLGANTMTTSNLRLLCA